MRCSKTSGGWGFIPGVIRELTELTRSTVCVVEAQGRMTQEGKERRGKRKDKNDGRIKESKGSSEEGTEERHLDSYVICAYHCCA